MIKRISMLALLLILPSALMAFPLDAAKETGIARLEGYRLAQQGEVPGNRLVAGALLDMDRLVLRLQGQRGGQQDLPPPDPELSQQLVQLLGDDAANYSISVLDFTDPTQLRYAQHQADVIRNPGSVGKLLVALSLFQTLADIYPDDIGAREYVLRNSMIVADAFMGSDHHKVPFWLAEKKRLLKRRLVEGDAANFWTYLDWMMSASSNAAASMVFKHVMLLRHFGLRYPVSRAEENDYFNNTAKKQLSQSLLSVLQQPVERNGFDANRFRQGGFFSHTGKRRVPGSNSVATARQLMLYLLWMEQGKLVDAWSSLQIKRLLYMTRHRIRYASSPALNTAAVYFKSGSFYKCKPEANFVCKPYQGNVLNLMNSVAIIEAPAVDSVLRYMVVLTSNVLRQNSAVAQQSLATRLHRLMQDLHHVHAGQQ
ncbi:MAG: hypothetical protein Q9M16_08315 [Mariprofundus sp.]|nr:hypothetical protein [Mariprofundus sp.]